MAHDDYKEMIPAHALSALDAADEGALNAHLAECGECRRDLAEWEATAASLALSADPMEPSPELREQILRRAVSEKSPAKVLPLPGRQRNVWRSLGSLGSIAAIIIFAALIIAVIVLWQQNRRLRQENEVVQLLSSPEARVKEMKGTTEAPGARAKIVFGSQGRGLLITSGLPQPPQGKEYQLWVIDPKKPPRPEKTFSTDSTGKGLLKVERLWEVEREYGVFAVTLEPAGGVASPTGAIYLRSDL
ncbi:MAG TPA: anti-sigma factor [Pyrinomonadaceae bacterium]